MIMSMICVEKLVKHFGTFIAIEDLSFSVEQGTVLGFLGPNGAGKTTTMRIITGFLSATTGRVHLCDYDIEHNPIAAKRMFGYLPEGLPAYPEMIPSDYLDFIATVRGYKGHKKKIMIDDVIEKVSLGEVLYQPIETLSKGFKRRVGLAQAILHDPPILILDEPTDGLDPNQKHEVRTLLKTMASQKAIIISTHILEEVEAICTEALIINKGHIIAHGHPTGDNWQFGDHQAKPGQLDTLFRSLTMN